MEKENHTLLNGSVHIVQPKKGFRASLDSVLLGCALTPRKGSRGIDLGTGVGSAALVLAKRVPHLSIEAIDFQEGLIDLANDALQKNNFTSGLNFHHLDVRHVFKRFEKESFDFCITNPPFLPEEQGTTPENIIKKQSHNESIPLDEWLFYAMKLLTFKGKLAIVHRADRLHDILHHLTPYPCGFWVYPIFPKADALSNRVVVIAQKGVKNPLKLYNGLLVHNDDNSYTHQASDILLHGKGLF